MDRTEAERLFEENTSLAYWVISSRFSSLVGDEDVLQEALIGLYKACLRYDESRGTISTVGVKYITNSILIYLRNQKIKSRIPIISLDSYISTDDGGEFSPIEIVEDPNQTVEGHGVFLREFISTLKERDKKVIQLSLLGYNQTEIGKILGISQSYCGRIISNLKKKYNSWEDQ